MDIKDGQEFLIRGPIGIMMKDVVLHIQKDGITLHDVETGKFVGAGSREGIQRAILDGIMIAASTH
jgi:hypothetical protein